MSKDAKSTSRSAEQTLRGYFYQFDKSILAVLDLANGEESITVEGIEDIDLHKASETTAIQCKYHESQEYFPSRIRLPLCLMLDDFVSRQKLIQYRLYVHFCDNNKLPSVLTVHELKEILSFTQKKETVKYHEKIGLNDNQLELFLGNFKIIPGPSYEEQKKEVVQRLKREFDCSKDEEVDCYYYNNALRCITSRAVLLDKCSRKISSCTNKIFPSYAAHFNSNSPYSNHL